MAWFNGVSERPRASCLARAQAAVGEGHAATVRHRVLALDPLSTHLLTLLDGTRDRASLIESVRQRIEDQPGLAPALADRCKDPLELGDAVADNLDRLLRVFARNGLLLS